MTEKLDTKIFPLNLALASRLGLWDVFKTSALLYYVLYGPAEVCTHAQLTCAPHVTCFEVSVWEFYLLGFHVPIYLLLATEAQNCVLSSWGSARSFWLWHEQFPLTRDTPGAEAQRRVCG